MIRVSTIIPVYNSAPTIARSVDSALAQNFEGHEIIVVNDGSTDSTAGILEGYGSRITVINQPNRGRGSARNRGLAIAQGGYIAFLDADDEWVSTTSWLCKPQCLMTNMSVCWFMQMRSE